MLIRERALPGASSNDTTRDSMVPLVFAATLGVLAAAAAGSVLLHVPASDFTRDPSAIAELHPLAGVVSNLGVLLWCATASVCAFAAAVSGRRFLLWSALLTSLLLFDDLFLFHEVLAQWYLGLPEPLVCGLLALCLAGFLWRFRSTILRTDYTLLAAALALFGLSMLVDSLPALRLPGWRAFVEDGAKFLGIASWFSYFTREAYRSCVPLRYPA